jgi:hypothetical protein
MSRRRFKLGAVLVLAIGGVTAAAILLRTAAKPAPVGFDALRWEAAAVDHEYGRRRSMAEHLHEKSLLIGLSREEVIRKLGTSDKLNRYGEDDFNYCIGIEDSPFAIDYAWLTIWFDEDVAVRSAITSD